MEREGEIESGTRNTMKYIGEKRIEIVRRHECRGQVRLYGEGGVRCECR